MFYTLPFIYFKVECSSLINSLQRPLVSGLKVLRTVLFLALLFLVLNAPGQSVPDHLEIRQSNMFRTLYVACCSLQLNFSFIYETKSIG